MSYAHIVEQHEKVLFADNVRMVAQQMTNKVAAAVTEVPVNGAAARVADLIGTGEPVLAENRSRRNPETPLPRSARWLVQPEGFETGEYIDKEDKWTLALDPTSQLLRGHVARLKRAEQDRLLGVVADGKGGFSIGWGGVMGKAVSGKNHETVTDLHNDYFVPVSTTGLTLDKLRAVKKGLGQADFGIDEFGLDPLYAAITPQQIDDLLGIAQAAANNLNAFMIDQLRTGQPTPLMGITWIVTNRLPKSGTTRYCPVWSKANIVAGWWQHIEGQVWNDTHAKNLPYIYASAYVDAVRVEDAGVRVIECKET